MRTFSSRFSEIRISTMRKYGTFRMLPSSPKRTSLQDRKHSVPPTSTDISRSSRAIPPFPISRQATSGEITPLSIAVSSSMTVEASSTCSITSHARICGCHRSPTASSTISALSSAAAQTTIQGARTSSLCRSTISRPTLIKPFSRKSSVSVIPLKNCIKPKETAAALQ